MLTALNYSSQPRQREERPMTTAAPRLAPGASDPDHPNDSAPTDTIALGQTPVPITSDAADIAESLLTLFRAQHWLKARLAEFEPEIGTTILLAKLTKEGPRRATELAEMTCSDPSTISRQVAALVKAGLVERKADPADGRASILVPTEIGHARVQEFAAMRIGAVELVVSSWSVKERAVFADLLKRYAAGMNAQREHLVAGHLAGDSTLFSSQPGSPQAVSSHPVPQQSVPDLERFTS